MLIRSLRSASPRRSPYVAHSLSVVKASLRPLRTADYDHSMSDPAHSEATHGFQCRRFLVVALVIAAATGCKTGSSPPTATECQQAIDHMLDLWAAADPEARGNRAKLDPMMPGLVKVCEQKYSSKKVKCLIAAGSKAEADRCTD
jgi:hypothetical protein